MAKHAMAHRVEAAKCRCIHALRSIVVAVAEALHRPLARIDLYIESADAIKSTAPFSAGQGESNLRGIRLTADNYEEAASAAIDYLLERPEVDPKKIGVYALSFGSYWGMRIAAKEKRLAAVAAPWASFVDKYYLMTEESPRYKQLFAYLTQSESEERWSPTCTWKVAWTRSARRRSS